MEQTMGCGRLVVFFIFYEDMPHIYSNAGVVAILPYRNSEDKLEKKNTAYSFLIGRHRKTEINIINKRGNWT